MTSSEWKNFLSSNFGISKSEAKLLYHILLNEVTYLYWLHAFRCRMSSMDFDYSSVSDKCFDCSLSKYCYPKEV